MGIKSRGNWNIGFCIKKKDCVNAEDSKKCDYCWKFSNYKKKEKNESSSNSI